MGPDLVRVEGLIMCSNTVLSPDECFFETGFQKFQLRLLFFIFNCLFHKEINLGRKSFGQDLETATTLYNCSSQCNVDIVEWILYYKVYLGDKIHSHFRI